VFKKVLQCAKTANRLVITKFLGNYDDDDDDDDDIVLET